MSATDLTIKLPPGRAEHFTQDRQAGHQATMAMLPDKIGPMARAASQTLWRVSTATDELAVRSTATLSPGHVGRVVRAERAPSFDLGTRLLVQVDINCTKTPMSDVPESLRPQLKQGKAYRSRAIVVPEPERVSWATQRMERIGLAVQSLSVSPLRRASLGRRGGAIPFVTITTDAIVTDANAFAAALTNGIGKGRNFGLGLILATPHPAPTEG